MITAVAGDLIIVTVDSSVASIQGANDSNGNEWQDSGADLSSDDIGLYGTVSFAIVGIGLDGADYINCSTNHASGPISCVVDTFHSSTGWNTLDSGVSNAASTSSAS